MEPSDRFLFHLIIHDTFQKANSIYYLFISPNSPEILFFAQKILPYDFTLPGILSCILFPCFSYLTKYIKQDQNPCSSKDGQ